MSTKKYTIAQGKEEYGGVYLGKTSSGSPDYFIFPSNISTSWGCTVNTSNAVTGFKYKIDDNIYINHAGSGVINNLDRWNILHIEPVLSADTVEWQYTADPAFIDVDFSQDKQIFTLSSKGQRKYYEISYTHGFWLWNTTYQPYGTIVSLEPNTSTAWPGLTHNTAYTKLKLYDHGKVSYLDLSQAGFITTDCWQTEAGALTSSTSNHKEIESATLTEKSLAVTAERLYFTIASNAQYTFVQDGTTNRVKNTNQKVNNSTCYLILSCNTVPESLVNKFLIFNYTQDSENHYDYLHFYKMNDDTVEYANSRDKTSGSVAYRLTPGSKKIQITYKKDGSSYSGTDTVKIDPPCISDHLKPQFELNCDWGTTTDSAGNIVPNYSTICVSLKNLGDYPLRLSLDPNNDNYLADSSMEYFGLSDFDQYNLVTVLKQEVPPHTTSWVTCWEIGGGPEIETYDLYFLVGDGQNVYWDVGQNCYD